MKNSYLGLPPLDDLHASSWRWKSIYKDLLEEGKSANLDVQFFVCQA